MAMMKIDGIAIKDPSTFDWGFIDASSEESGRSTNDAKMNKDIIASKRKLSCSWVNPSKDEVKAILQLVSGKPYYMVTYPDALSGNDNETREFTVGDRSAPMKIWTVDNKRYSSLAFNFIER